MALKRSRILMLFSVALVALAGIALLAAGLFAGRTPAEASSSTGDYGTTGGSLTVQDVTSGAILKRSPGTLVDQAGGVIAARAQSSAPTPAIDLGLPSGGALGGLPAVAPRLAAAQGSLDLILAAVEETGELDSYDYVIDVTDPFSGPVKAEGQYVAPDKAKVFATDRATNERDAIIWGDEIYVKNPGGQWTLVTREELDADATAATKLVGSFADNPNIFASLGGLMVAADEVEDLGEVELNGAGTRHYKFVLDGTRLLGGEGDAVLFGSGEIFVDLTENRVYALNYDIDFVKLIEVIFGAFNTTPTATATPGTPAPVIHLIYNLQLSRFDEPASFQKPQVRQASPTVAATNTRRAQATTTRRATNTPVPTRTPTVAPTSTPGQAGTNDAEQILAAALTTMVDGAESYHFDLEFGQDQVDENGDSSNVLLSQEADVLNPDKLRTSWIEETNANGEAIVSETEVIRIGDDVYVKNEQTNDEWEQYDIDDVGEDALATVIDPRPVIDTIELAEDEEIGGVVTSHVVFTFDMQELVGQDFDLSGLDYDGGGEAWIDQESGYLVGMSYHWFVENPDTGARIETRWNGAYSAFDEPLEILPPSND